MKCAKYNYMSCLFIIHTEFAYRSISNSFNLILICGTEEALANILRESTIQPRKSTFTYNILFSINEYFVF